MAIKGCVCEREQDEVERALETLIDLFQMFLSQSNKLHFLYVYVNVPESRMRVGQVALEIVLIYPLHLNTLCLPNISAPVGKFYFIQSFIQIVNEWRKCRDLNCFLNQEDICSMKLSRCRMDTELLALILNLERINFAYFFA